jgi:hypothetical protein
MNQSKGKASPKTSNPPTQQRKGPQRGQKPKRQARANAQTVKSARQVTNLLPGPTGDYIKSVNDPFEHQGCRLGWGCMVPSTLVTAYVKGSVAANADGTLALSLQPNMATMVVYGNGGAAVSFATSAAGVAASDAAGINTNYTVGRIVSGGIRAYPNIPMTTAPGACYVGSIPGLTFTQLNALTPNDLSTSPYLRQFRAYEGGTAVSHPEDVDSFAFNTKIVSTAVPFAGNDDEPNSNPLIAFVGIGNATLVFYEAVYNIEVIAASTHGNTALGIGNDLSNNKLST